MSREEQVKTALSKLELTSDLFFSVVLEDIEACQEVIYILTGRKLEILEVKSQYTILNLEYHSIRLDIWAKEVDGRYISLEMHPQSDEDRVKRTRYNVGSIDTRMLKTGEKYKELPDVIHIYITKADFLKTKKAINYVKRTVDGTDVTIPNGIEEYYISLSCEGDTTAQTELLKYMVNSTGVMESDSFPNLVKRVRLLKKQVEGHEIMCEILDKLIADEVAIEVAIKVEEELATITKTLKQELKVKVEAEVKEEAKAEVEEAKAEVEEAKAEVEEAKAEVKEAKAEVEEAKAEVAKTKDILVKGFVKTLLEFNLSPDEIVNKLVSTVQLKENEARFYVIG